MPFASTPNPEFVRPVMWRFVVVALVVEAFDAKSDENIWCAQVLVVVVPNASEIVFVLFCSG